MAGNSQRKGAKRSPGSKKGAVVGSGGAKSKGLRPKGPTPRAEDRTKAAKRAGSPGARTNREGSDSRASYDGTSSRPTRESSSSRPPRESSSTRPPRDAAAAGARATPDGDAPRPRSAGAATRPTRTGAAPRTGTRSARPAARPAARTAARSGPRTGGARSTRPAPRKGTGKEGSETVVGRNSVVEALRAKVPATALYVAERIDADDRVREAIKLAADSGLPILECPRAELDRLTAGAVHQGLGLQVPPYTYAHPDDLTRLARDQRETPLVVALDGVTDPRNLGAVVRSAAAFGAHGVLVPDRRSAGMTAGAWKASAGAAARITVARATNLTRQLEKYRADGYVIVGLSAQGLVSPADLEVSNDPLVLVVGSEDAGLSRLVERTCDVLVRIPMSSGNESLNAGVAAGIVLYEVAQHRHP